MTTLFLDTEFTDLHAPELLSIGLCTDAGQEFYVELDLQSATGKSRVKKVTNFVSDVVLEQWGLVPGATCTELEMGRRVAEWILGIAGESGNGIRIAFDYQTDYELLERLIRISGEGLWERVCEVAVPMSVSDVTDTIEGEVVAEGCYRELEARGLTRHHALADAIALRAAYLVQCGRK